MKRQRSYRNINGVSPENDAVPSQTFTTVNIAPQAPSNGITVYAKPDDTLYYLTNSGVETPILSGSFPEDESTLQSVYDKSTSGLVNINSGSKTLTLKSNSVDDLQPELNIMDSTNTVVTSINGNGDIGCETVVAASRDFDSVVCGNQW